MSEVKEKKLVKKLANVMKQVKHIEKNGYNSFHKYKYVTESDVAEKIREVLAESNVMMIPNMTYQSVREHTSAKGKVEYIATVVMEFTFYDGETGEEISFQVPGEGQDSGDKAIYKAITGAQKYAMMKAFMIPTGDDPEQDKPQGNNNNSNSNSQQQRTGNGASEKQLKLVNSLIDDVAKMLNLSREATIDTLKKRTESTKEVKDYTSQEASKAITYLQGVKESQNK